MLCGNDITGRGIFKRTSIGVIYGYAQHSVFKARINGNFFIIDVFFFAGASAFSSKLPTITEISVSVTKISLGIYAFTI